MRQGAGARLRHNHERPHGVGLSHVRGLICVRCRISRVWTPLISSEWDHPISSQWDHRPEPLFDPERRVFAHRPGLLAHHERGELDGRVTGSWGCAVRRRLIAQRRNRSDLLPLRPIASFVIAPGDRLDAIMRAYPQDPVTLLVGKSLGLRPEVDMG